MDRMTDRGTNTLASRGLEELFFQLCCCVSFWFWQEIGFGFTYLRTLLDNFFGTNIFLIVVEVFRYFVCQFRYFRTNFLVESEFFFQHRNVSMYVDTLSTLGPHSFPNTPNTMYR